MRARELKVTLWYPTEQRGGQRSPYMTAKEAELLLKGSGISTAPYDTLSRTRTHAVKDAAPSGRGLPLVVLSPGFTKPMSTLTSLAEPATAAPPPASAPGSSRAEPPTSPSSSINWSPHGSMPT